MLSRGVDIKGATHVINASVPADAVTYLHRAGRVGRYESWAEASCAPYRLSVCASTNHTVHAPRTSLFGRMGGVHGTVISLPRTVAEEQQLLQYAEELGFTWESRLEGVLDPLLNKSVSNIDLNVED